MLVYKITNLLTKRIYIGKAEKSLNKRYSLKWWKFVANKPLKNDIEMYGYINFKLEEIDKASTREELEKLESFYIKELNSLFPNGYNLKDGHHKSSVHSATRKQISDTMKKNGTYNKGLRIKGKHTECIVCGKSFYSYFSRGKLNVSCSAQCRSKIYGRTYIGTNIKTEEVIKIKYSDFKEFNLNSSKISMCINGKKPQYKGYKWEVM